MQEGSTAVALAMVTPGYDQDPASGVADYTAHQDQAQFEADKRAVYKHPLFPLLALLFERCEQATQSSDNSTSESFNMDIQAFVQHQERDRKPFLINDPEIDGLMIKAIQVLRIHLLELEKVQELCKDFCNRYITCLKGKMQSENLLRSDYSHHGHDMGPSSGSNGSSPLQVLSSTGNDVESGANGFRVSRGDTLSENGGAVHTPALEETGNDRPSSVRSSSTAHRSIRSSSQDNDDPLSPSTVHGSTPLSQIGAHSCPPVNDMYLGQDITVAGSPSPAPSEDEEEGCGTGTATSNHSSGHGGSHSSIKKGRQKRGVLPKHATSIMRTWLFEHLVHPYPTEDEKRQIASQTNLTLLQVNNWFINARRRILQPMLDGAGADPVQRAGKRHKVSKHVAQQQQQQQAQQQQAGGWQSEDSASDSGSSDGEGGADRSKDGNDSDEDDLH
ncbi:homeobox protein PKNOX2-like isoform X1 [Ceratina calcarata]|uniref:Homeobox protein PKNOX2-like isoform X1 n=1 Tax=Ceratina calcarata TaxID=156304 RepID=A0AAJ7WEX1_9HYME|nr:homeobox protein PKNOX2-like isoform X1 [Ceratina calcarata]XP_026673882.1 homeobox protein PKNOX2-like isoform X1 [Ceratina calcarata]XP_026673886.1 homeobox protein PKNOX2-like isoform X1 [Ceratina calcarata]XP_026673892.1 homeobox protein PKNOX2-like isoform X1 [Ceratina calcarata]XP_026673894.1 homeobox protein PKNOX2-like isoform X1 [Ceratina calcarata]XP_026673898.1 homeobox protein PKNOX2-like isoform X1 [Ceratina calcarata]